MAAQKQKNCARGCKLGQISLIVCLMVSMLTCDAQNPLSVSINTTAGQFPASEANGPTIPSCGYGPLSLNSYPFGRVASINANSPLLSGLPQSGCGACFQLTCEAGAQCAASNEPVVVQLVDSGSADLTIRQQEFASLAPAFLGNIPVSAQLVNCTPPGDILIRVLEYRPSGGGYLKLTFLNVAGFIGNVLVSQSQASMYQAMTNTNAAVWEASNLSNPPLDVRIISTSGQSVTAVAAITNTTQDSVTTVQFGVQTVSPPPEEASSSPSAPLSPATPSLPDYRATTRGGPFSALQQSAIPYTPLPTGNPVPTSSRASITPTASPFASSSSNSSLAQAPSPTSATPAPASLHLRLNESASSSSTTAAAVAMDSTQVNPTAQQLAAVLSTQLQAAAEAPSAMPASAVDSNHTRLPAALASAPAPAMSLSSDALPIPIQGPQMSEDLPVATAPATMQLGLTNILEVGGAPTPAEVAVSAAAPSGVTAPATSAAPAPAVSAAPAATATSSLQTTMASNPTAAAAAAINMSAGSYLQTDAGLIYDLRTAAGNLSSPCKTPWQLIEMSQNLTTLASIIQAASLVDRYNSSTNQATLLTPLNSAFAYLSAQVTTLPFGQIADVLSYQTALGFQELSSMHVPASINTSLPSTRLTIIYAGGNTAEVEGASNVAHVLQTDIPACGPSLLQLTDAVLIPPGLNLTVSNITDTLLAESPMSSTAG